MRSSGKYEAPHRLPKIEGLPDPFVFADGRPVKSGRDWERRAEELQDLYQYYMYGYMPDTSKENVSYVMRENGLVVTVEIGGRSAAFPARVSRPKQAADRNEAYPVIVSIGSLPGEQIARANERGYAVVTFDAQTVAADSYARTGAFFELYPYDQEANDVGAMIAWAWGAGKVLDVLEQGAYREIDPERSVVTGFSRFGKAALVTGALDDRFAVVNPHASGAGGAASYRYSFAGKRYEWGTAEAAEGLGPLQSSAEGHWFNAVFLQFRDAAAIPVDQHELAALVAPRGLLLTGGYADWWTNPEGMFVSYTGASKVYDFLNAKDGIGFAFRPGGHARTDEDLDNLLDFSDWRFNRASKPAKNFKESLFTVDPAWDAVVMPESGSSN